MRIRKNAKLCSSEQLTTSDFPGDEHLLQPHICQLNQSPWDVISYSQYYHPFHPKFEGDGSFVGTWSNWDTALPSFPVEAHGEMKSGVFADDADSYDLNAKLTKTMKKKKKKKRGVAAWHEKKEPIIDGDYRLPKCSSSVADTNSSSITGKGPSRRPRIAKRSSSSNPYEFYYYSGFRPSWGKRRGESGNYIMEASTTPVSGTPSPIHLPGETNLDLLSDDDYTLDEEGGGSKRSIRKLVKARSLKSLM